MKRNLSILQETVTLLQKDFFKKNCHFHNSEFCVFGKLMDFGSGQNQFVVKLKYFGNLVQKPTLNIY